MRLKGRGFSAIGRCARGKPQAPRSRAVWFGSTARHPVRHGVHRRFTAGNGAKIREVAMDCD